MKKILLLMAAILVVATLEAQAQSLPRKVSDVTIRDMHGNPANLPYFGKKNLLIFYVDPDSYLKGGRNKRLSDELEENKRAAGPAIYGFGVLNFPDTGLPKELLRKLVRKRCEKNGATVLDDNQHIFKNKWGLGDCNGKFVYLIVSKEGELVYMAKENLDEAGIENFYKVIDKYRK